MLSHQHLFLILGALLGFLAVAAGAFGSHLLKARLSPDFLTIFEVAARYQMYHALALVGLAACLGFFSSSWLVAAGWLFFFGTLIFSGSLYILVFSGIKAWGAITPIGGTLLLLGWAGIIIGGFLAKSLL